MYVRRAIGRAIASEARLLTQLGDRYSPLSSLFIRHCVP